MNADEMRDVARRLDAALRDAGVVIERADVVGGNIKRWERIPAEALVGRMLQLGWRVRQNDP